MAEKDILGEVVAELFDYVPEDKFEDLFKRFSAAMEQWQQGLIDRVSMETFEQIKQYLTDEEGSDDGE